MISLTLESSSDRSKENQGRICGHKENNIMSSAETEIKFLGVKPISLTLPEDEIQILTKRYNSDKTSPYIKESIQRKLGGRCVICGGLAEHIASYDCAGATRIERYCDACVKKTFARNEMVGA